MRSSKRSLAPDDIDAVCDIYPPGNLDDTCTAIPIGGLQLNCETTEAGNPIACDAPGAVVEQQRLQLQHDPNPCRRALGDLRCLDRAYRDAAAVSWARRTILN